ncbi:alcohol dehydrogenase [Silvibacterium sp.]|uniref:alcohol dehydrogenase n=1 Tax=Silvibacterium sp. TaxID=1964179 RepID=UPI0039E2E287
MKNTYSAMAVVSPGRLELVERAIPTPASQQVLIRVEACGVCHSDGGTIEAGFPGLELPRVPGHEVVGRIEAVGTDVTRWSIGQRVGVGFIGGYDGSCPSCLRGDFVNCENPVISGVTSDGGYAELMLAESHGIVSVPEDLTATDAAPLLCAGLTTFNALRNSGARGGDLVAILGVGGLGHLGIQFARKMGFETVAIGRGQDKESLAKDLGAHHYINSDAGSPAEALQSLGGATVILATAPSGKSIGKLVPGLAPRGKMIVVAVPGEPIPIQGYDLVFGTRSIEGMLTGKIIDGADTLKFSVLQDVRPMVETFPLKDAATAYAKMMRGDVRFRAVLIANQTE